MSNATIADVNVTRLTGVAPQERAGDTGAARPAPGAAPDDSQHSFTHALADAHAGSAANSGNDAGKRDEIGKRPAADPQTDANSAAPADPAQDSGTTASASPGNGSSPQSGDPAATAGAPDGAATAAAAKPAGSGKTAANPVKKLSPAEELLADIEVAGTAAAASPDGAPAATPCSSKDASLPTRGTTLPPDGSTPPAAAALPGVAALAVPVALPTAAAGGPGLPADDQTSELAGAPGTSPTTVISTAAALGAAAVAPVTGADSGVAGTPPGQATAPSAGGTTATRSEPTDGGTGTLPVATTAVDVQDTRTNAGVQLAGSLEKFSKLLDAAGITATKDPVTPASVTGDNAAFVSVSPSGAQAPTVTQVPGLGTNGTAPGAELPPLRPASGSAAWAQSLGDRMVMMTDQGLQQATLRMDPEHLGPVQVHIQMDDGNAQILFSAHHSETRAALEDAIPRLRELFQDQGLNLTQANVDSGRGTFGQRAMPWEAPGAPYGAGPDGASLEPEVRTTTWRVQGGAPGRIDLLV